MSTSSPTPPPPWPLQIKHTNIRIGSVDSYDFGLSGTPILKFTLHSQTGEKRSFQVDTTSKEEVSTVVTGIVDVIHSSLAHVVYRRGTQCFPLYEEGRLMPFHLIKRPEVLMSGLHFKPPSRRRRSSCSSLSSESSYTNDHEDDVDDRDTTTDGKMLMIKSITETHEAAIQAFEGDATMMLDRLVLPSFALSLIRAPHHGHRWKVCGNPHIFAAVSKYAKNCSRQSVRVLLVEQFHDSRAEEAFTKTFPRLGGQLEAPIRDTDGVWRVGDRASSHHLLLWREYRASEDTPGGFSWWLDPRGRVQVSKVLQKPQQCHSDVSCISRVLLVHANVGQSDQDSLLYNGFFFVHNRRAVMPHLRLTIDFDP